MEPRKKAPIILSVIPLALLAAGVIATAAYGVWANARGMWTEGGEWLIFIFRVLPAVALIAVPLAVVALVLNKRGAKRPAVIVLSVIDLVFAVPVLLIGLLFLIK
ncbi:MAG: hypothetical protein J5854_02245 [Clostridia bacterium]|nr:hypothetical protein [Clostridia bacterium]